MLDLKVTLTKKRFQNWPENVFKLSQMPIFSCFMLAYKGYMGLVRPYRRNTKKNGKSTLLKEICPTINQGDHYNSLGNLLKHK